MNNKFLNTLVWILTLVVLFQSCLLYLQSNRISMLNTRVAAVEQNEDDALRMLEGIVRILEAEHTSNQVKVVY